MSAAEKITPTLPLTLRLAQEAPQTGTIFVPHNEIHVIPGFNPRTEFEPESLKELAQSIFENTIFGEAGDVVLSGIRQNCGGRPREAGGIELCWGERRVRAVGLLVEGFEGVVDDGVDANGQRKTATKWLQVSADYPVPMYVRAMNDAEMREAAILENVQREDMSLINTADACAKLKQDGRNESEIALKLGLKPQQVYELIQLSVGLGKEGRKLLTEGKIGVNHAQVIASVTGQLKKAVLEQAKSGASVQTLIKLSRQKDFLVEFALFDVQKSELHIDGGLLGDMPAKFTNPKAAHALQLEALETLKAEKEQEGTWKEVVIVPVATERATLPYEQWVQGWSVPDGMQTSVALVYSTVSGEVNVREGVARKEEVEAFKRSAKAERRTAERETQRESNPKLMLTGSGVREAGHLTGHEVRSMALDAYFATHERECLALYCVTLLQGLTHQSHLQVIEQKVEGRKPTPMVQETVDLMERVAQTFPGIFTPTPEGKSKYTINRNADMYGILTAEDVTVPQLLSLFTLLMHRNIGIWTQPTRRPTPALRQLAERTGAAEDVKRHFTMTSDFLQAFKGEGLTQLIATMPLNLRPAPKHNASKKDVVSLIMERQKALKEAGWTPEIVQFV